MLSFKKYSSIENSFSRVFIEKVALEMPADLQYVVQEKVHGANSSFLCDGEKVSFAKRTAPIEPNEDFYNYQEILEAYSPKVLNMFARLKEGYPQMESISVFGELFGGAYPHPEVKRRNNLSLIQKGVFYTPAHEFYGFDIYIFTKEEGFYLPVDEANALFEAEGFFYAKTLFQGNLRECLNYPNAFQSKISEWLGLPQIEENICEGVVIKPVVPMFLRNGNRVIIKNKNEKFAEKKRQKANNKLISQPVPYSDEIKALLEEMDVFVTENRLTNVVSHIGEVSFPQDFGRVMGLFAKDIFADFNKEFAEELANLEKSEQKSFSKQLNKAATELVKKVYMSHAYITPPQE